MKEIKLVLDDSLLAQLGLEPNASAAEIGAKVKAVMVKAQKVDTLTQKVADLETELADAQKELADEKAALTEKEVTAQLEEAVEKGLATEEESKLLAEDYKGQPDKLKAVLKTRKPYQSVTGKLNGGGEDSPEVAELAKKSYKELWREGKLARLEKLAPKIAEQKKAQYDQEKTEK